ncbi:MAG: hypothetical protein V4731_16655 [Pseudomonadota bacterium]
MVSPTAIKRVQQLIWVLIYGGLLTVVLGISVSRTDDTWGWSLISAGAVLAVVGAVLIYVRSRVSEDS